MVKKVVCDLRPAPCAHFYAAFVCHNPGEMEEVIYFERFCMDLSNGRVFLMKINEWVDKVHDTVSLKIPAKI